MAAYIAGRIIYARGPASHEQVLAYASFSATSRVQNYNLNKAITNGWLVEADRPIDLSVKARHCYAGTEPQPKQMGSMTTPGENVHAFRRCRQNIGSIRAEAGRTHWMPR